MAEEEYEFDPWETSSGLPDFLQVRIENPHFGYDANIGNGQTTLFKPEGTVLSGDGIDEPQPFEQFFGCGPGWEPAGKGGTRIVREDGKARKFNNNVAYAHLFTSLKKAAEAQDMMGELRKRGTTFDAATWQGLVLDLERTELPEFTGSDGKPVKRSVLLVKNIVKMGDAKAKAPAEAPAAEETTDKATVSSGETATNGGVAASELDPKLKAQLRKLARETRESGAGHNAFVERAFEMDGVMDNAPAEQAIMESGDGSIWESVAS